jgi:hypothetical protein
MPRLFSWQSNLWLFIASMSIVFCGCIMRAPADTPLTPVQDGIHNVALTDLGNGEWEVRATGPDPYFFLQSGGKAIDLKSAPMLSFGYFSTTGTGRVLVFVGSVLDIPHLITAPDLGVSEGWSTPSIDLTTTPQQPVGPVSQLRLTFGTNTGAVVRMRQICARPRTPQENFLAKGREQRRADERLLTTRLQQYFTRTFDDRITWAGADSQFIRVEGHVDTNAGRVFLAEVPLWEDGIANLQRPLTVLPITPLRDGRFQLAVKRIVSDPPGHDRDRLLSAWSVVRQTTAGYEMVSSLHFVDTIKPRANLLPACPVSLKGLGGCPFDSPDLDALGIASLTCNVILTDLFFAEPAPNRTAFRYLGKTWYVDNGVLGSYDAEMRQAASRHRMVSAIVLMRPPGDAPQGSWIRQADYPYADPIGIYVLPNFTCREGVEAYAAAMNFLAERYSRPDGKYGRVHHWIMHNEVNAGFFWANAGERSATTYMDIYQKSMRVAYLIARQYDPNAKVLISLEHDWARTGDSRAYGARTLLDLLVAFSKSEGDFEWGIAFHPYPQDIANPRTWEDSAATYSFDTPFLTFKNIEVLNAWAERPQALFRGKTPREIQLTEEGFNTDDYSEKSLTDQAAGLAYAWEKIEPLKNITAFQYHLWMDDASEGGLRLGLREFPTPSSGPIGAAKPSWDVFKAAGTDGWGAASDFAKGVIGISDWSQIRYTGPIH